MKSTSDGRVRMIFDIPPEIQIAIKLQAVKSDRTTGEVVREAVERLCPAELIEARTAIAERG